MSVSIWLPMFRAATARVNLRRPAGALVIAALTAAALLWAGPPAPAGAQDQSSDTSLSGITVDGNDAIKVGVDYHYGVPADTTQVTVAVMTTHTEATAAFIAPATDADANVAGHQVNLSGTRVLVSIRVTAQNGTDTDFHSLAVNREGTTAFSRKVVDDLTTLAEAGNENPSGLWSDGTTVWVGDGDDNKLYAYQLDGGARDQPKDFDSLDAAGNDDANGLWSDGETMWVSDTGDDKLYAYRMSDRARDQGKDFDTLSAAGNNSPHGLWSDGETMWVADSVQDKIFAYSLSDKRRRPDRDFNTLQAAGNTDPWGIWSDGITMWVSDTMDDRLFAYRMSDRSRDSGKEFDTLRDPRNFSPRGLWSDGETMWVADSSFDWIFSYNLAAPGALDLSALSFNGQAVSGFDAAQRSYTISGEVALTADVTMAATAADTGATLSYTHEDVFTDTTGRQVALDEGANLIRITVSKTGQPTVKTYELHVTAGDAPNDSTSRAFLQVDEEEGPRAIQFRGAIEGSEDARDIDWINVTLEADQLYAIVLKGGRYGDTDRTLHVPFVGGVLSMGVLQDGTDALGVYVSSGIDGRARALFKPTTAGDYQVVVAGALVDQTGIYDLRVRRYEDDHFPNGIETGSTISFPTDNSLAHYPSAAVTGQFNYEFDDDWFQASGLAPGHRYVIEARHGIGDEPRRGRRYLFIKVYDAEGEPVEVEPDLNRYIFTSQSAQDYYIRVYSHRRDRSRYTLYLHPTLSLTGNTLVGDSLSVDPADIYDPDGTERVTRNDSWRYTWRRTDASGNVERIRGARGSSYQLTDDDAGHTITGRVCYKADSFYRVYNCRYYSRSQPVRAVHTVPSDWARVPSGLDGGDRFRLLLVSEDKRTATETDIAAYNTWAQGQVTGGHADIQEYADHFAVLGSTSAVSARANTGTDFTDDNQGIPIYWLGGQKAADHYDDFWDGSWGHLNPGTLSDGSSITFTESDFIWTGTSRSGYEETDSDNGHVSRVGLGNSSVMLGQPYLLSIRVLSYTATSATGQYRMYILSHPFQVEESTATQQGNQPATGRPVISGAHNVGDTVTADVTGIADADGLTGVAFSYQWLSGDSELTGETNSSYTLASTDFGQAVAVRVTFTDDAGNEEVLTSEGIYPIMTATENTPATGQPTISGTALVGQTLAAGVTGIADADGLEDVSYSYQWLAGSDPIADATSDTYTLTAAELSKAITVRVRFTDNGGNEETLTSAATTAVTAAPNSAATGQPQVVGTALVGARLSVDTSGIADADGLSGAQYRYQWLTSEDGANTEIAGATGSSYRLTWREDGKSIEVRVSFTDDGGNEESLTSPALHPVRPSGLAAAVSGETVVLSWEPPTGFALLFDYRILREAPELGGNAPVVSTDTGNSATSYTDRDVEPDVLYRYRVKAANYWNQLSPASDAVEIRMPQAEPAANTPATGLPTISGIPQVGQTLTASVTSIADQDGLDDVSYAYQWLADDVGIAGATAASYTLTSSEEGKAIKVRVSFTDDSGNAESLTSAATDAVAAPPTTLTASIHDAPESHDGENSFTFELRFSETPDPNFSYETLRDQALTASGGTVTNARRLDPPGNVRWEITVEPSSDAEVSIVLPETTDCADQEAVCTEDGRMLSAEAALTVAGPEEEEEQTPPQNNPATGTPAITGTAQVGQTLTAGTGGISDENGLDDVSYAYRWLADGVGIAGATAASYTLTSSEEGKAIKVQVSFTDDAGNEESLTSAATDAVASPPTSLTASIHEAPESHDGENSFTFELRFSETPVSDFSYKTLRDHSFTVTGGTVTKAQRLDPPGNVRWEITVEPSSDAGVSIVLPETTDCDDQGAVCTGDGRMLSVEVALTVAGPEE